MTVELASLATPGRRRRLVALGPWVAIVVVAAVALIIGTQRHPGPQSLESRTLSVAGQVRCETCVGETAAQSQSVFSVQARAYIKEELQAGESPSQILDYFKRSYGPSAVEDPSTHGSGLILWFLPVGAVVVAVLALVFAFRRWRPAAGRRASEDDQRLVEALVGSEPSGG